jgi:ribosomal protein S12 methylthiotransferase accessory factor
LAIPVFGVIRPDVSQLQITAAQGKGVTGAQALASALFEAAERHAAANYKQIILASTSQLRTCDINLLTPEMLGGRSVDPAAAIDWIEAIGIRTRSRVLVPAAEVVFPYIAPKGVVRPFRSSTTGLAAGNTIAEAILHGVFEVIERDAVSRCFVNDWPALIDTSSITDPILVGLINRIENAGIQLLILDLSAFAVVPTFKVLGLDPMWQGPTTITTGQGSHTDSRIALRRAVLEFAQARAVAIQGSREDLSRYQNEWQEDAQFRFELIRHFALQGGLRSLTISESPIHGVGRTLGFVFDRLDEAGYKDVLYIDLTHHEVQIPAVRVIVPGMVDTFVDPDRKRKCSDNAARQ